MSARLREFWQARSARERQAWLGGLALAVLAAGLAAVIAAVQAREPLLRDVLVLRTASATMQQQAGELDRLRRLPAPAAPADALRTRVQAALDASLPQGAAARLEALDPRQVVVVFETVDFAAWLRWTGDLAGRQVRLESCRIEALPAPGQVRVTATLVPSGSP